MSGIVWLASYPKSGNTWLRAFLSNYLFPSPGGVDINSLPLSVLAADRRLFDRITGLESSDLTHEEIDRLTPAYYRRLARLSADTCFVKIHSAFLSNPDGEPQIPSDATRAAVYVVRNPLDVVVSFAHHLVKPFDEIIANMENPDYAFGPQTDRMHHSLRQRMLSWSAHVAGWLDQKSIPVHAMRYEDMRERPDETFANCLRFLGLEYDAVRMGAALEHSSFGALRAQELANGFRERPETETVFFRNGTSGQWKTALNGDQIRRVTRRHGETMARLGYI